MTTWRDYVLDCRCPNCGVMMERSEPKKRNGFDRAVEVLTVTLVAAGLIQAIVGHYGPATFSVLLAVALMVSDR